MSTLLLFALLGARLNWATSPLTGDSKTDLAGLLADRFGRDATKAAVAGQRLMQIPFTPSARDLAWSAWKEADDSDLRAEFDANTVKTADRRSPFLWRTVGTKPGNGWGLVIAMHGGGGVPAKENDAEWRWMFDQYYLDHPESGGYVHLALRAPNDDWNGFYDDAISPLVERLIQMFVKYGSVDPNRVYACGASHGGYGAFVIGPKIPYRFAAVHPAASAPSDGQTQGENLRNLRFTWAVGERDTEYGRVTRARAFEKQWLDWRSQYGGFDGGFEEVKGADHFIKQHEENKLAELLKFRRTPNPKRVIWVQSDDRLHRSYWIEAVKPSVGGRIDAEVRGNVITLKTQKQDTVAIWLSSDLVDLHKPLEVIRDGKRTRFPLRPSLGVFCDGLAQTADPWLAAPIRLEIRP